ncbi:MAG: prepilin-type N-terminal cleavage/methylation domain-containing protein [Sedimentisphaerales bacterium]
MTCLSEDRRQKTEDRRQRTQNNHASSVIRHSSYGFTLIESMAAVTLLAFIGAGVWLVVERCSLSAANSTQRMRAFETARDNMEKLLGASSVEESTEYGISEQFPDIRWQTTVETFYQPVNSKTWARAVASADYTDSAGETKTISLTNWLTELTDEQVKQVSDRKSLMEKLLEKHLIDGNDLAAQYVGVTVDTVRTWVKNGMPTFEGAYIKPWLDLYLQTNGQPTDQDIQRLVAKYPELATTASKKNQPDQAQPQQTEPATDTESSTETQTGAATGTQPSTGDDLPKLPDNLDPAIRKQLEQLLKKK